MVAFINSQILRTIPLLLIAVLFCPLTYGNVIYVDDDAVGANDGTSWENAYVYLQDALTDAAGVNNDMVWGNASIYLQDALADTEDSEKSIEIRVARGLYTPDRGKNQITGNRWATFQLINGVKLMGGFAGLGATDPNTRNISLYETILSGDLNGDDGALLNSNIENSYHIVTGNGTDLTAVMDGFTIRDGNANRRCYPDFAGGGMFLDSSSPTVANCSFIANYGLDGGGMSNDNNSNPNLINCTFNGNLSDWGGGMANVHGSSPTLTNCLFIRNHATNDGGGMYNGKEGNVMLINCTFNGNSARSGGAMQCDYCSSIRLVNTILWNDVPDEIFLRQSFATVTYCDIQGGWPGEGNIDIDPLFADPYNDDFHLKSQAGRLDEFSESWVIDDVTSPCIDTGDPNSSVAFEPFPNGIIINIGVYGNTAEASKSPSGLNAKYSGGTGESKDPYQIATAEDLITFGETPEDYDKHFILTADIDLDLNLPGRKVFDRAVIAPDINDVEGWYQGTSFTGVFDGNDHIILNLTIKGNGHLGLFGQTGTGASISNLGLEAVDVSGGGGGLVGDNWGTITSCYSTGLVTGRGGLVGLNYGSITMSYSTGSVIGTGEGRGVGGLVGSNIGIIMSCYSTDSVSGDRCVGGLVGWNDDSSIIASYSTGSISGETGVGGLVGCNSDSSIISSYSTGLVSGDRYVGGLAGSNYGNITMSYSIGVVTGNDEVGGLVGYAPEGSINLSFWDMETSNQATSDGGTGLITIEMRTAAIFLDAGWDFIGETINGPNDVWKMWDGYDYPRLSWEVGPNTPLVFVDINDPGFCGQMSEYEVTNAQYCDFLNAALASGDITIDGNDVYGADGTNSGEDYIGQRYYRCDGSGYTGYGATNGGAARIHYNEGAFSVESGFGNHPVTYVSWYGAMAFANYYGYYLPTEEQWQAVADYDGTYIYGCGQIIDPGIANYRISEHPDGTMPVGSFGIYGYGMADMAGNVWEWTSSSLDDNRIFRGGSMGSIDSDCSVSIRGDGIPYANYWDVGFRVCR
jgi:hypothetical protein